MSSYIRVHMVMVVGMMWLSILIIPSSAQLDTTGLPPCLAKINDCIGDHFNRTLEQEFNAASPFFNKTEFYCCPLVQHTVKDEKQCFCTIGPLIDSSNNPITNEDNVIMLLTTCNIVRSRAALDTLCLDASSTPDHSSVPSPDASSTPDHSSVPSSDASSTPDHSSVPSPVPDALTPQKYPAVHSPTKNTKTITIAIVVPSGILVKLIAAGLWLYCKKRRTKHDDANFEIALNDAAKEDLEPKLAEEAPPPPAADVPVTVESLQYELGALLAATKNFSDDNMLGRGGFGVVYKGTLQNGQEIAVKRLTKSCCEGDKEFKNEVEVLAKLQHRNLVRMLGFCLAGEEKLLVYELVQNKSLDYILFDPAKQEQLNWPKRFNIIKGIARGMLYLHEDSPTRIAHRDLKAANVLLDAEMNPKISDFGIARIFNVEQTHANTSRIIGTDGYMAPEYRKYGHFSVRSDVYSFGVLILEIVSGRRVGALINQSGVGEDLVSYAWRCYRDSRLVEVMDPTLRDSYARDEVIRCIHIGLLCVQEEMTRRPAMSTIIHMLSSYSGAGPLPLPEPPAFLNGRYGDHSTATRSNNTDSSPWSQSDISFTNPNAR